MLATWAGRATSASTTSAGPFDERAVGAEREIGSGEEAEGGGDEGLEEGGHILSKILASLYSFAKERKASRIVNNYIIEVLICFPESCEAKVLRGPTCRAIHEAR
jgi:hypothetical protein